MRLGIVGGGPAGMAAAIWARRLGLEPILFERTDRLGGQLHQITLAIPDLPGYPQMPAQDYLARMAEHVALLSVPTELSANVVGFDSEHGRLWCQDGREFSVDRLMYAPGLKTRELNIPGHRYITRASVSDLLRGPVGRALVVGGGDRALEAALRLVDGGWKVHLAHRRRTFRARPDFRQRVAASAVVLYLGYQVVRIISRPGIGLDATLVNAGGQTAHWIGDQVVVRIGMEPDVVPGLAGIPVNGDTLPKLLPTGAWAIGDAVTPSSYRSLLEAMASAMRAVKAMASGFRWEGEHPLGG